MFVKLTRESGRPTFINLNTVQSMFETTIKNPVSVNAQVGDPVTILIFNGKEKLWVRETIDEIFSAEIEAYVDFDEAMQKATAYSGQCSGTCADGTCTCQTTREADIFNSTFTAGDPTER